MAEYSEKGLTLRWDAPDLVPSGRQGSQVRASSSRPVRRTLPTWSPPSIPSTAARRASRAVIGCRRRRAPTGRNCSPSTCRGRPTAPLIAFVPVLSCSGREADPRRGGVPLTTLVQPAAAASATRKSTKVPRPTLRPFGYTMELLGRVTARVGKAARSRWRDPRWPAYRLSSRKGRNGEGSPPERRDRACAVATGCSFGVTELAFRRSRC